MNLLRFEMRRLIGYLRQEFAKDSGKHGGLLVFIGVKEMLNAFAYLTLGIGLTFLARFNLKTLARSFFGVGEQGMLIKWLSGIAGDTSAGRLVVDVVDDGIVKAYGATLIRWADLVKGSLVGLTIVTLILYGLTSLSIALGLYYHKKWAEYIAATASILYVPLEIYGIWVYHSWTAGAALAFNIFIILYLCKKKGLFLGYFSFHPDRAPGMDVQASHSRMA